MRDKNATQLITADAEGISLAAETLRAGGLVAVPTETVYGLAARADSAEAVERIYRAKGRPGFNPLIVHVRDAEQAARYVNFSEAAHRVADKAWPGPLTLVLPLREDADLAPAVTAGLPTAALRAPAHPVMRQLLDLLDFPLAAPSANRSGFISPTTAQHVLESLDGKIDLVLDGGIPCENGLESTILAIRPDGSWDELRPGPIDLAQLHDDVFGEEMRRGTGQGSIEAPGQLTSHYAPGKPVRLNVTQPRPDEFMIGLGEMPCDVNLSASGNLEEAAAGLYAALHLAAASAKSHIAFAPIAEKGIGKAINDRLRRASA
ncbi:L-threonylcarbamoyladenylate synthase [Pontixanthobacter luteolus]|uniref:L-threonylcarbamoyladenylate synthase n=1 Tax=Pontixanthobacter luteolus TaxID=295089 RepID=UPI00230370DE|nr:L-threonylcarbamoyladenylate synthase [Pontixanthobacter luteolus]